MKMPRVMLGEVSEKLDQILQRGNILSIFYKVNNINNMRIKIRAVVDKNYVVFIVLEGEEKGSVLLKDKLWFYILFDNGKLHLHELQQEFTVKELAEAVIPFEDLKASWHTFPKKLRKLDGQDIQYFAVGYNGYTGWYALLIAPEETSVLYVQYLESVKIINADGSEFSSKQGKKLRRHIFEDYS